MKSEKLFRGKGSNNLSISQFVDCQLFCTFEKKTRSIMNSIVLQATINEVDYPIFLGL